MERWPIILFFHSLEAVHNASKLMWNLPSVPSKKEQSFMLFGKQECRGFGHCGCRYPLCQMQNATVMSRPCQIQLDVVLPFQFPFTEPKQCDHLLNPSFQHGKNPLFGSARLLWLLSSETVSLWLFLYLSKGFLGIIWETLNSGKDGKTRFLFHLLICTFLFCCILIEIGLIYQF